MNAPPDAPPARPSAWPGRFARLRWFMAEFVVVVAGVLVALAVSSWAEDRHDRQREQAYLRQLGADLAANEKSLVQGVDFHRQRAEAAARVLHRFWREHPQADDTFVADLSLPRTTARYRPVLGTAEALISTGDLNLVRSDTLRAAILAHVDSVNFKLDDIARYDETYYRPAVTDLYHGPDIYPYVVFRSQDHTVLPRPATVERAPFPIELADMLHDRNVYDGYNRLLIAHRNPAMRYGELLEETRALIRQVDAQLEH